MAAPLPPLLVAGHSHSVALGVPAFGGERAPFVAENTLSAAALAMAGSWPRDAAYWSALVAEAPGRAPLLAWDGNQHQGALLFAPDPPVDFVLSSSPAGAIERGSALLPESALRELFAPSLVDARALFERLVAATTAPVLVAATPPPKGDTASVRSLLAREQYFIDVAKGLGSDLRTIPLTAAPVLLKAWRLVQDMMRELCAQTGAVYVPAPRDACTAEGYLAEDCWSGDVTHANERYGCAMLATATATLERCAAQPDRAAVA